MKGTWRRAAYFLGLAALLISCSTTTAQEAAEKRCADYAAEAALETAKRLAASKDDDPAFSRRLEFTLTYTNEWQREGCVPVVQPLIAPCVAEYKAGTDSFLLCVDRRAPNEALHPHFFGAESKAYAALGR